MGRANDRSDEPRSSMFIFSPTKEAAMTEVTNEGTACQADDAIDLMPFEPKAILRERLQERAMLDYADKQPPITIKPLSHWRGVEAGAQPGEPGWQKLGDI